MALLQADLRQGMLNPLHLHPMLVATAPELLVNRAAYYVDGGVSRLNSRADAGIQFGVD